VKEVERAAKTAEKIGDDPAEVLGRIPGALGE